MNVILCETATREGGRFNAGNKARSDALKTACNHGYEHVVLFVNDDPHVKIAVQMIAGVARTARMAGGGDTVLVQYPYHPDAVQSCLFGALSAARAVKRFRLVVLVHDIEGLRAHAEEEGMLAKEVVRLSYADTLIVHSPAMEEALKEAGLTCETCVLGPFDYLYQGNLPEREWSSSPMVDVAGNLTPQKSGYVYELQGVSDVTFELFGAGFDKSCVSTGATNLNYMGARGPEELVGAMTGQYGLVWDGPTASTCAGPFGEYLRYNSPHKFSLYVAAGMPVVVWSGSALASLVTGERIGIAVDSLEGLGGALHAIDEQEYRAMIGRLGALRGEVVSGGRLSRWL